MTSLPAERSLPDEVDFAADPAASPARMNRAMLFLIAWLRRLESVQPDFLAATEQLRRIGLERLDAVLSPIFLDAQAIAAQLDAIEAQWLTGAPLQQLLAELETRATARLTEADLKLVAVQQAIAGIGVGVNVQAYSPQLDALALIPGEDWGRSLLRLGSSSGMMVKLGLPSSASWKQATAAEVRAATASKALSPAAAWEAATTIDLVDAATIAVDLSTFINAKITLAGNRTLGAPSGAKPGQTGAIEIKQDATGGRTLAYATAWKLGSSVPSLSTAANARDVLYFQVLSDGSVDAYLSKGR